MVNNLSPKEQRNVYETPQPSKPKVPQTSYEGRKPFDLIDEEEKEISPSLKQATVKLKNLEKLMASLTEKFKSTFNGTTTTSSSFIKV